MVTGVGAASFHILLDAFGSPQAAFAATKEELMAVDGIGEKTAQNIKSFTRWEFAEREAIRAAKEGVSIVIVHDDNYPPNLRNIYDPPPFLYVKEDLLPQDNYVAIVGSRLSSEYRIFSTQKLVRGLTQKGFTIVSGLARGVDAVAYRTALAVRGRTIAVLGCGIDVVYLLENKSLFQTIPKSGAIISEYAFGTNPSSETFL